MKSKFCLESNWDFVKISRLRKSAARNYVMRWVDHV